MNDICLKLKLHEYKKYTNYQRTIQIMPHAITFLLLLNELQGLIKINICEKSVKNMFMLSKLLWNSNHPYQNVTDNYLVFVITTLILAIKKE